MIEKMQAGAIARSSEEIRVALMTTAAAIPENERRRGPDPQGPRLVERRSRSHPGRITLYIRDGKVEISTRLTPAERVDAETMLDLYKLQKGAKERGIVAPRMVPVVVALAHLLDADRPTSKAPKGAAHVYLMRTTRLATLARYFKDMTFKDVTTAECKNFIEWRTGLPDARYAPGNPKAPLAQEASAREDLYDLKKAIDTYANENALSWRPEVYLPKAGPGRTRWLRPEEIDRIYWAIRGRIWDHEAGGWKTETVADDDGNVVTRRVLRSTDTILTRKAMRRFVFIGQTTGTRNTAMRELRWQITDEGGCFDLDAGLIHRRGFGLDPNTGKPRASSRISPRTVSTLERWRRADFAAGIEHVIHKADGTPYADSPRYLWRTIMEDAGLGGDVVPHTLRHTAATMLRIAGVDVRRGADLLGMAVQTMVRVYGQWTIEGQEEAAEALGDIRSLRKAMPILSLVPNLPEPVVMAKPANDDASSRGTTSDRRHIETSASRVSRAETLTPPRAPARLAIVA